MTIITRFRHKHGRRGSWWNRQHCDWIQHIWRFFRLPNNTIGFILFRSKFNFHGFSDTVWAIFSIGYIEAIFIFSCKLQIIQLVFHFDYELRMITNINLSSIILILKYIHIINMQTRKMQIFTISWLIFLF